MNNFEKALLKLSQSDRLEAFQNMYDFGTCFIRVSWNKDEGEESAKADVIDPMRIMCLPTRSSYIFDKPNGDTCPDCHRSLIKSFDGEQTYIQCTAEPQCTFHALLGDGDLTK